MIKLEYFTADDFATLKEWISDEQLLFMEWISDEQLLLNWAGSSFRYPLTDERLNWYIKGANDFDDSDTLIYKAVDNGSGKTLGHISLTAVNRPNRSARITRVIVGNPAERGKKVGEQMIREVMRIGFEDLKLHRMSLGVYEFNEPAIRCYKNCGFHVDGVLRDISRHGDTFWSIMEMSILEDEWTEIKSTTD
jgi:RimJ/RimL family protein N-acetyltransferase